jgi:hypothetical protein
MSELPEGRIETFHAEDIKRRYRVVDRSSLATVPGEVVSANPTTGECTMREKDGTVKTHNLGPGGLAIVTRVLLPLALILGMTACAQTQMDTQNAAALAQKAGDAQGAQCWAALGVPLGQAPQGAGVAYAIEAKRLIAGIIKEGPCAQLAAEILVQVGSKFVP